MSEDGTISAVRICKQKDFSEDGSRQLFKHGVRNIAVFNIRGNYYAIDNACYHHGGPLHHGDVEDMGGHPCVICPWHSYRIALDTGEGLYRGINLESKMEECRSKGIKQRVYTVKVDDDGYVVVMVDLSGNIESDTYATMTLANQESASRKPTTQVNNLRNIHSSVGSSAPKHVVARPERAALDEKTVEKLVSVDVPHVRCVAREPVSADGSTVMFSFELVGGFKGKGHDTALRPGQWVTLELPVTLKDAATTEAGGLRRRRSSNVFSVQSALSTRAPQVLPQHTDEGTAPDSRLERTFTVIGASNNHSAKNSYGWFSIAVKNISGSPHAHAGGYGSQWIHHNLCSTNPSSPSPTLRLVERGGTFSIALNRTLINNRRGRVVLITGGVGITPVLASVREMLNDGFTAVSGPALHMLHVHVDSTVSSIPFLAELLHYRRELKASTVQASPVTYRLRLFCTKESALPSTPSVLAAGPREIAADSDVAHATEADTAILSPFAAMLSPTGRNTGSSASGPVGLVKGGDQILNDLSEMAQHGQLQFKRRPAPQEVFGPLLREVFGGDVSPADTVVMVCGPEALLTEWTKAARAAGCQFNSVLSEKFDF